MSLVSSTVWASPISPEGVRNLALTRKRSPGRQRPVSFASQACVAEEDTTSTECTSNGGDYQGDGTVCDPNQCICGDLDGDGDVDDFDFQAFLATFGRSLGDGSGLYNPDADFDGLSRPPRAEGDMARARLRRVLGQVVQGAVQLVAVPVQLQAAIHLVFDFQRHGAGAVQRHGDVVDQRRQGKRLPPRRRLFVADVGQRVAA